MSLLTSYDAMEAEEEMLQRALGVEQDGDEEDEDQVSAVPSSGEEYLKQVMREAKRLDDVVTGEYGHMEVRSSFITLILTLSLSLQRLRAPPASRGGGLGLVPLRGQAEGPPSRRVPPLPGLAATPGGRVLRDSPQA